MIRKTVQSVVNEVCGSSLFLHLELLKIPLHCHKSFFHVVIHCTFVLQSVSDIIDFVTSVPAQSQCDQNIPNIPAYNIVMVTTTKQHSFCNILLL